MKKQKKLLIYLYIYFNGNQKKIIKELLEKNEKITQKQVNDYFKNNRVLKDYITIFDDALYPEVLKEKLDDPILVFKKSELESYKNYGFNAADVKNDNDIKKDLIC